MSSFLQVQQQKKQLTNFSLDRQINKNIKEISEFTEKVLKPYIERQNGVASVTDSGSVEDSIEIRLNEDKIDAINDKVLFKTNEIK